jgi:8-oxo-dGTP pyrophosphatase MutT (NUDIX family)
MNAELEEAAPGESSVPRPAATIILLRRGGTHAERRLEVLLARRTEEARFMPGVWVFPGGAVDRAELERSDEEAAHRACAARELAEEAGIELGADAELVPWSRWITPEPGKVRFDTRFYVALAPAHASPEPDDSEITEVAWISPADALERHAAGELKLVFPTIRNLEALTEHASAEEVLAAARERVIEPILPKVIGTKEDWRVALPGDPDYPADGD